MNAEQNQKGIETLLADNDALRKLLAHEQEAHEATIRHRDFCEQWADKLASGVGDIEVIGEHSNLNNPWETAYGIMRSHVEFEQLLAENAHHLRANAELAERVAILEEALRPFSLLAVDNPQADDGVPIRFWSNREPNYQAVEPTMADCRRAAALLATPEGTT